MRTVQTLHRQARRKGEEKEAGQKQVYQKLIETTEQMVQQARKVLSVLSTETRDPGSASRAYPPLVERVITRTRVLLGKKMVSDQKVLSLFESQTRAIPRNIAAH